VREGLRRLAGQVGGADPVQGGQRPVAQPPLVAV
jgi:hypothetical protein